MNRELLVAMMLALLSILPGCDVVSPFISEDLKMAICDRDNDGLPRSSEYCGGNDCNDNDATVGQPTSWFRDVDGDTFGAGEAQNACSQPDGYVDHNGDCDDTDELVNPNGTEVCNGYDDNCNEIVDDENIPTWYEDSDVDTFGNAEVPLTQCDQPEGYVSNDLDCDDDDLNVHPDGTEVCDDGIDQDCNDIVDDAEGSVTWYADTDGDGWGDPENTVSTCVENPTGYVDNTSDCDDGNEQVNPDATEVCDDGIDNNCNGTIDTDTENVPWYRDADMDGYGDKNDSVTDCAPPTGYIEDATDCNDSEALINPGVEEVCNNGIDDNCDESRNDCEWSTTVSLSDADATIDGTEESGYAGFALVHAGDINGDGYEDLLMSASQVHEIYVFFGPIIGALNVSMADIVLFGPVGSFAGMALAGSCDLQGDGSSDDILIGAPYDSDGGSEAGAIWILHGPFVPGSYDLDLDADRKILGEASSRFGASVACGDQDGDGDDDILVGASNDDTSANDAGAAYIGNSPVTSFEEMFQLSGEAMDDAAGTVVLLADVNGDGLSDAIVGAFQEDEAGSSAGAIYVFLGPVTDSHSLESADAKLLGENPSDFAGRNLQAADLDGDGNVDLLVGAYGFNASAGAAYVVYGPITSGSLGSHPRLDGEAAGDNASFGLAPPCDFDGDGVLDLFVGAREEGGAGATYVVYGPTTMSASLASAGTKFTAVTAGDYAGATLATLDLDADGFCDLIVGAYLADDYATNAGRAYVLYGLGY